MADAGRVPLILLAAACAGALAACDILELASPRTRVLEVYHHRAECVGESTHLCLLVREPDEPYHQFHYFGIAGFAYEWGFIATIEVEDQRVANPPADGSSIRTVLRRVIAKQRVPPGTQFVMTLTTQVGAVGPDRYSLWGSTELTCLLGDPCAGLADQVAARACLRFRFEHPATAQEPLRVVRWALCSEPWELASE